MPSSILVVEDEVIVASDLHEMLREEGYDVPPPAYSVAEARERFEEGEFDLVFLDVNLSGNDEGIELAQEWGEETDIVFVSAYLDEETLEKARSTEALGYVTKPATEDQVLDVCSFVDDSTKSSRESLRRGELFAEERSED